MKIRCRYRSLNDLPAELRESVQQVSIVKASGKDEPSITPGKEYVVYGLHVAVGNVLYMICDDLNENYPLAELAVYFEVVDGRPSRHWYYEFDPAGFGGKAGFRLWPKPWLTASFLDKVTDGDSATVREFRKLRADLDAEASSPEQRMV